MSDIVLNRVTFLNGVTASTTSDWYKCDFKYAPEQTRTIVGTMNASDVIYLEGTLDNVDVAVSVVVTLESTSLATFAFNVNGPWSALRIRKTGTNGAATVKGIV